MHSKMAKLAKNNLIVLANSTIHTYERWNFNTKCMRTHCFAQFSKLCIELSKKKNSSNISYLFFHEIFSFTLLPSTYITQHSRPENIKKFRPNSFFAISKMAKNQFLNQGKSLKLPKMQFHEKNFFELFDFTSFFFCLNFFLIFWTDHKLFRNSNARCTIEK